MVLTLSMGSDAQFFSRKVNQLDEKGRRQGRWITWQDSVRRLPSSKAWFRDGKWKYYDERGKLIKAVIYRKGENVSEPEE